MKLGKILKACSLLSATLLVATTSQADVLLCIGADGTQISVDYGPVHYMAPITIRNDYEDGLLGNLVHRRAKKTMSETLGLLVTMACNKNAGPDGYRCKTPSTFIDTSYSFSDSDDELTVARRLFGTSDISIAKDAAGVFQLKLELVAHSRDNGPKTNYRLDRTLGKMISGSPSTFNPGCTISPSEL